MVGILTFYWADNYGALLQAYALKRYLEKSGERADIIPYAPYKLAASYWFVPFGGYRLEDGSLRYRFYYGVFLRNLQTFWRFGKRRKLMRAFRRRYLTSAPPVRKAENVSLEPYRSVFIGSDQVWNPEITAGMDDAYIGNLPKRGNCRLISYGASFGGAVLSEADQKAFIRHVGGFHAVSVREPSGAKYAGQLLGRETAHVLDPSLLLDRSDWEELAEIPPEKDYVLLYQMPLRKPLLRYAQALSAHFGKKLVAFSNPADAHCIQAYEPKAGAGPAEFVGYVRNAFCVITNSFHGTALAILFEKPFLTYCQSTRDVRQKDLLENLGLASHLLELDREPAQAAKIWASTDWEEVRARLSVERERSRRFIDENKGTFSGP